MWVFFCFDGDGFVLVVVVVFVDKQNMGGQERVVGGLINGGERTHFLYRKFT